MFCKHHAVPVTCAVCVIVCLLTVADCLAVNGQNNYAKLENEVAELKAAVQQLKSAQRATRSDDSSSGGNRGVGSTGTTYIRWGRTTCGSGDARVLYRGHAAGAHYNLGGGGSNHLCLHETPQWAKSGSFRGQIYGIEFELFDDRYIYFPPKITAAIRSATIRRRAPHVTCQPEVP